MRAFKAPPINPGDRVIIASSKPGGPGRVARVVNTKGDRVLVRQRDGKDRWLHRCRVRYEPTQRILKSRLDEVRRSWSDSQLRSRLGLPVRQDVERYNFDA